METLKTLTYEVENRIARITLNRPERGNGITMDLPRELAECVEKANLDPDVHVIALAGNGSGFCGGYDLVESAEERLEGDANEHRPAGSALDPATQAANHDPNKNWDPTVDYAMMSRNVKRFMSLFHGEKPVVCKVHGFCVAGGTDMALCSDLLVIADDAKIGYPPARVWGSPTTAMWVYRLGLQKAKRLLLTGDCLNGKEAEEWGLAIESAPPEQLDNQGLDTTQMLGTLFDGITRHTPEGYSFQQLAAEKGFKEAVRERDEPFGDYGMKTFKG